jgi:hypothetical protein
VRRRSRTGLLATLVQVGGERALLDRSSAMGMSRGDAADVPAWCAAKNR